MERRTQLDIGIYNDATQIGVVKFFFKSHKVQGA